jgi:hypothetical protein
MSTTMKRAFWRYLARCGIAGRCRRRCIRVEGKRRARRCMSNASWLTPRSVCGSMRSSSRRRPQGGAGPRCATTADSLVWFPWLRSRLPWTATIRTDSGGEPLGIDDDGVVASGREALRRHTDGAREQVEARSRRLEPWRCGSYAVTDGPPIQPCFSLLIFDGVDRLPVGLRFRRPAYELGMQTAWRSVRSTTERGDLGSPSGSLSAPCPVGGEIATARRGDLDDAR